MVTTQDWLDAQYSVIGSVLISPQLAPMVMAQTSELCFDGVGKTIYQAMRDLFREAKPVDAVMVGERLGEEYTDKLIQIMEITPTAAHIEHYIALVKEHAELIRLRDVGIQLQNAETADEARAAIAEASSQSVQQTGAEIISMDDAMREFYTRRAGKKEYLTWPIEDLNDKLYVDRGDFLILAGYPSDGKTALAIQTAFHLAQQHKVGFFSLETNPAKIHDRLIAHAARVPFGLIKRGDLAEEYWDAIASRSSSICRRQLEYISAAGKTVSDIQAITMQRQYDIIFVDYLQLVSSKAKDRYSAVTEISIGLHTMAQEHGVTVIALSQLSRPPKSGEEDSKKTKAPQLSSLRESGQIEQDADVVLIVYRPDANAQQRMLLIRKNKEGELGSIALDFDGQYQTFRRSYARPQRETEWEVPKGFKQVSMDTPVPF